MINRYNTTRRITGFCLVLLLLAVTGSAVGQDNNEGNPSFHLSVRNDRLSLQATDGSVKAIAEELGRQMNLEVEVINPQNETITTEWKDLTLPQALRTLSERYVTVNDEKSGKIRKIILLPKGAANALPILPSPNVREQTLSQDTKNKPSKPFTFEFNPAEHVEK